MQDEVYYTPITVDDFISRTFASVSVFLDSSKGDKKLLLSRYMYTEKAAKKNRVRWKWKIEQQRLHLSLDVDPVLGDV